MGNNSNNIKNKLFRELKTMNLAHLANMVSNSTFNVRYSFDEIKIPSQIELILPKQDFEINVDRVKFQTVITNILKNAIDAIDEKGYSLMMKSIE